MSAISQERIVCDLCRSRWVRRVWSDHLKDTPSIFECGDNSCPRDRFLVLRIRGQVRYCGIPERYRPLRPTHSATQHAFRNEAMSGLSPTFECAIRRGLLKGVEHV